MISIASPSSINRSTTNEPGFGAALLSEWTKFRSVRSTWIMVGLTIGLSIGFSALIALVSGLTHDSWNDTIRNEFDPVLTTLSGWLFGLILMVVLAVTSVTSECGSKLIRTTFIVSPRRGRVFAAKAIVLCLLGVAISAIAIPGMFLISQPIYGHYGLDTASVTDSDASRYLIVAVLLQGIITTLIPFSFAWLFRSGASAITFSIGFSVLPWMLLSVVPLWVQENVLRYLPDNAKDGLIGVLKSDAATYLGQTPSIIVIAAWIVGLLAAAAVVVQRRDV
jgi:ABC-type transport system involved in multi-copper enzyme maturation permease subunit